VRHGTYLRKVPEVAYVARYRCPTTGTTIGLLPDFYASRLPGTLPALEYAVVRAEGATTMAAAANELRPGDAEDAVTLPSAVQWVRRRLRVVHRILVTVLGLLPDVFEGCEVTVRSFRERLATPSLLVALRGICERYLAELPAPLGLVPAPLGAKRRRTGCPQSSGADPPGPGV